MVDLSETYDELPDLDPRPQRATIQQAALRQAYVLIERLNEDLVVPQLPVLPVAQQPDSPLSIDWNQLEYQLPVFDNQEPQAPQPQIELHQDHQQMDWGLVAVAHTNI